MNRASVEKMIGKTFADSLDEVILTLGDSEYTYTRRDFIELLGCANFSAAPRLERALKKLNITSPRLLYKTDPFSLVRLKGVGAATLYIAMCILDEAHYDVEDWWGWNETNKVKFSAFKHNAIKRGAKVGHE